MPAAAPQYRHRPRRSGSFHFWAGHHIEFHPATDQLRYNRWLAAQAHARGLSVGLKNDGEQAAVLQPAFDWALTEDCFQQGWCDQEEPFLRARKAVFSAEYTDVTSGSAVEGYCVRAAAMGISLIYKQRDLGAWARTCGTR